MNEHVEKAHQEIATRNSQVAVQVSRETRAELEDRIDNLEKLTTTLHGQVVQLTQKYNLLLSNRFSGGSTAE